MKISSKGKSNREIHWKGRKAREKIKYYRKNTQQKDSSRKVVSSTWGGKLSVVRIFSFSTK